MFLFGRQKIIHNLSYSQSEKQNRVSLLTPTEYDLYLLLLEGFPLKASAKMLSVNYMIANKQRADIYKKLEVNSQAEIIVNYRNIK